MGLDLNRSLQVRFDWESDGIWDTAWDTLWSSNKTMTHRFSSPGEYNVTLEVLDSGGLTNISRITVEVVNEPPVPFIAVGHILGDLLTTFVFDCSGSFDLEDPLSVMSVRWDFNGDGIWDTNWSTDKVAYHQYSAPGNYTVVLEVRDSQGLTNNTTVQAEVVEAIPEFPSMLVPVLSMLLLVAAVTGNRLRRDGRKKPR